MATLRETFEHLGITLPPIPTFRTEDIPYLVLSSLLPVKTKDEQLISMTDLVIAFALRIEDLEQELFKAKWTDK